MGTATRRRPVPREALEAYVRQELERIQRMDLERILKGSGVSAPEVLAARPNTVSEVTDLGDTALVIAAILRRAPSYDLARVNDPLARAELQARQAEQELLALIS